MTGKVIYKKEKSRGLKFHPCLTPLSVDKKCDLPWGVLTQAVDLE